MMPDASASFDPHATALYAWFVHTGCVVLRCVAVPQSAPNSVGIVVDRVTAPVFRGWAHSGAFYRMVMAHQYAVCSTRENKVCHQGKLR